MSLWRQLARGLRALTHRSAADREVADEVQHYLEQATAAHAARGLSPEAALRAARETMIESIGPVTFEADELEPPLRALAEARAWKAGDLFMAIRVAVTGRTATPPLFDSLVALGRERTLARLDAAIDALAKLEVTA